MNIEQWQKMFSEASIPLSGHETQFLEHLINDVPRDAQAVLLSALYSSKLIEKSLAKHADALVKSAEASEKYSAALVKSAEASERHAKGLKYATWVLAFATILLFVATVMLVLATYLGTIVR